MLPAHLGIKGHTLLRLVSLYFRIFYPRGVWKLPGVRLAEGDVRGQLHSKALGAPCPLAHHRDIWCCSLSFVKCVCEINGVRLRMGGCSAFPSAEMSCFPLCCWKALCIRYWTGPRACSPGNNRNCLPVSWNFSKCSTAILKIHALEVLVIVSQAVCSGSRVW